MATPVLNNGIFLREVSYETTAHVDSYHLYNLIGKDAMTDLGPVELFAHAQKVEIPLYQMASFGGKNVIMVQNSRGEFKWDIPILQDLPTFMEDIEPGNTEKGRDGSTFKVKVSRRAFSHGDVFSYDKYNGVEIYITDEDILDGGDKAVIYTCRLVNNDNAKFLDNKYIKHGTKLFRKTSAKSGEYGEKFSDLGNQTAGHREYYNYVGGAEAHCHFHISSKADMMAKGGLLNNGRVPVTELWRSFDSNLDPSIRSLDEMAKKMGKDYMKKSYEKGTLVRNFVTTIESKCIQKVANDIESYAMWGHGGRLRQDGPDDFRLSVGLWKQLDNAWKKKYNKGAFTMDFFKGEIFNFFAGRVSFEGPDPKRKLIVQTGIAGMRVVSAAIERYAFASNLVMNATELGAITGKGMNLDFGFAFTSFTIPYLANVQFVLNPAFDSVHTNDIENPIIDGHPLSSYSFVIFDVTDQGSDNIFLLKWAHDHELKWFYQNGTMDYMGRSTGFASTGLFSGYKVYMQQTMPAIWVKDPTRVLKIVMTNPITGGSL
jgi:hypothetical protein